MQLFFRARLCQTPAATAVILLRPLTWTGVVFGPVVALPSPS